MSDFTHLAARVQRALLDIQEVVDRISQLEKKASETGDRDYLDAVALNLHGFYTGIERIFEDIVRTIDVELPTGPEWHRDLLLQASAEVAGKRPAVISKRSRDCLEEYRGFRHVVRNVYTFSLRPTRIQELSQELPACFKHIRSDLDMFVLFIQSLET